MSRGQVMKPAWKELHLFYKGGSVILSCPELAMRLLQLWEGGLLTPALVPSSEMLLQYRALPFL
jgi:hypothetical protein